MPLKQYKPTSPGRRWLQGPSFEDITRAKPERSLVTDQRKRGGRNVQGRITVRHQGGGHKQAYRMIDFRRNKPGVPGRVDAIEYDPNRSARIALIVYADGEKRYILSPDGLTPGVTLMSGPDAEIRAGNALPLHKIPLGTMVHAIEVKPGKGAQFARSAGTACQIMARDEGKITLKLPSSEIRLFSEHCLATVGQVGNLDHSNENWGKAGRSRWKGKRPKVRGVAMNPHDHPHGGGEGKSSGGRHPVSPWGVPTKGYKTRKKHRTAEKMIVKRRQK